MKVLFVNEAGVRELLPMKSCVALMRDWEIAESTPTSVSAARIPMMTMTTRISMRVKPDAR